MNATYYKEFSSCLNRDMEFNVYGYAGQPILVFPAQDGRFYDFDNFGMVDTIQDKINAGKIQLFCVDSIDKESWSDTNGNPEHRIYMQEQWYYYVCHELVPRIHQINRSSTKIYTTGCSMGATHAVNFMFRRPDLFKGTIALSGYYDSDLFFGDYCNELIYNNAPIKYLSGMPYQHPFVEQYRHLDIVMCCGQGAWEDDMIRSLHQMKDILHAKQIPAWIDFWGKDVNHDWPWWKIQFPYFIDELIK